MENWKQDKWRGFVTCLHRENQPHGSISLCSNTWLEHNYRHIMENNSSSEKWTVRTPVLFNPVQCYQPPKINTFMIIIQNKQKKQTLALNDHPKMSLSSSCEISPLSKKQIQEPKSSAVTDEHMHNYIWILMCEGKCACKNKECESERASERRERVMMGDDAGLCWGLKGTRHVILVSQRTWACMVRGDWWSVGYIRKASI